MAYAVLLDTQSGSANGETDAGLQMDTLALALVPVEFGMMAVGGAGGGGATGL